LAAVKRRLASGVQRQGADVVDPLIAALFFFVLILALPIALVSLVFSVATRRSRSSGRDVGFAFLFSILFSLFWLVVVGFLVQLFLPAALNDKTGRDLLPWLWQWSLILSPVAGAIIGLIVSARWKRSPASPAPLPFKFDRPDPPAPRG
jgi:hypothetical protein